MYMTTRYIPWLVIGVAVYPQRFCFCNLTWPLQFSHACSFLVEEKLNQSYGSLKCSAFVHSTYHSQKNAYYATFYSVMVQLLQTILEVQQLWIQVPLLHLWDLYMLGIYFVLLLSLFCCCPFVLLVLLLHKWFPIRLFFWQENMWPAIMFLSLHSFSLDYIAW